MALLLVFALFVSACAGGQKPTPTPGSAQPSGQTPSAGPKKPAVGGEMVVGLQQDPDVINPILYSTQYGATLVYLIFEGLVRLSPDLQPVPDLAKEWKEENGGLEYTFTLPDNATFHDGTPLTAEDVEFTYNLMLHPDYGGPRKSSVAPIKEVRALDKTHVKFTLKERYAPFLVTAASYGILPKHLLKDVPVKELDKAPFNQKPVGSGPFKFVEWKSGQYVLVERNDKWHQPQDKEGPWLDRIRLRIIKEENTRVAALEAGEIDLYDTVNPADAERLKKEKAGQLNAYDWERMGWGYILFNTEKAPTSDKAVRQALSYALNRPVIIEGVLNKAAKIPPGPVPPVMWAFDSSIKGYDYDPKKAAELLEKAGYKKNAQGIYEKDGKPLKLTYYGTRGSSIVEGIALQAQKDWKALGVDVQLDLIDFNTMLQKHQWTGDFNVSFLGFTLDPDPDSLYNLYHSSAAKPDAQGLVKGFNRGRYKNQQVDELFQQGRAEPDQAKRKQIYSQVQKLLIEDAPVIWVYSNLWTDFTSKKIKGVTNVKGYGIGNGSRSVPYWSRIYINEK